jgi:hypothetical protein
MIKTPVQAFNTYENRPALKIPVPICCPLPVDTKLLEAAVAYCHKHLLSCLKPSYCFLEEFENSVIVSTCLMQQSHPQTLSLFFIHQIYY